MPPKKPQTIKIRKLGVGGVFSYHNVVTGENETWKIIGRPNKSGNEENGQTAWWVPCSYVSQGKLDQTSHSTKHFNLNQEVVQIRQSGKDFDAIDKRDQPGEVTSIESLMKQVGAKPDNSSDLDGLIGDEEVDA